MSLKSPASLTIATTLALFVATSIPAPAPPIPPDLTPERCNIPVIFPVGGGSGLCNDGNPCTNDACVDGFCVHEPRDGATCRQSTSLCIQYRCSYTTCIQMNLSGNPCPDDGNPCSDDICSNGACTHPPKDGFACTPDSNECTDDVCQNLACAHLPNTGRPCTTDGLSCTEDVCANGQCTHAPPPDCEDGNPCTLDHCFGSFPYNCAHDPLTGGGCDDGNPCTLNDQCVSGTCAGVFCNDGNPCTVDSCIDSCHYEPIICTDTNPCTNDYCSEGLCHHDPFSGPCNDLNACTINDTCTSGLCHGVQNPCDDNNACSTPIGCDPQTGCEFQWLDCDDGDPCTIDTCSYLTGECSHPPLWPPLDECGLTGCFTYEIPPLIFVNNDDDNANGIEDSHDAGPVSGEDDLWPVSVAGPGCLLQGGAEIECYTINRDDQNEWNPFRFFAATNKLNPAEVGPWPPPPTLYLEARESTFLACGIPLLWGFSDHEDNCPWILQCLFGTTPIIPAKVGSVAWEKFDPENADLGTCPINGGLQIFPDKLTPDDATPTIRQQVNLVATADPPIAGLTVYFKVWDVDDPFDQLNPSMPDVSLIDANTTGPPDNRGPEPLTLPWSAVAVTGASGVPGEEGIARVTFTVSMQPGNNYRAAASLLEDAVSAAQLNQTKVDAIDDDYADPTKPGDFQGYKCPATWSPMLTVWRKLHIEFDSMEAEPTQATSERDPDWKAVYVTSATSNGLNTVLHLGWNPQGASPHQYEGGRIKFNASGTTYGVRNNDGPDVEIDHLLSPQESAATADQWAILKDDDPESGLLPHLYVITPLISAAFADAYVSILELPTASNPNRYVPFDLYLSSDDMVLGNGWNNAKDGHSETGYWGSFVLAAYQAGGQFVISPTSRDNDPDGLINNSTYPNPPYWTAPDYDEGIQTGWSLENGEWDSVIFRAAVVDYPTYAAEEDQVIAHEIGHSAGDAGSESEHHAEGGLMSTRLDDRTKRFTGKSLERFRKAEKW